MDKKSRKKIPKLTNYSYSSVVLETQDEDSDGYGVRNCAVLLFVTGLSSDTTLIAKSEPIIPSPFLSSTFTLSFLFVYFIS